MRFLFRSERKEPVPKKSMLTLGLVMGLVLSTQAPGVANDGDTCHPTGAGLDAHFINETPASPLEVTCDVGVYFDQDGNIDDVDIRGTVDGAQSVQYGVLVDDGADVNVTGSSVAVAEDYPGQFLSIAYRDAATGTVDDNDVSGGHRVGILLDEQAEATVKNNTVEGTGPKDAGWAENGIQVSRGASGTVIHNTVSEHWRDKNDFLSSGVIVFGSDDVTVNHNTVSNNDLGVAFFGDRNTAGHNTIAVEEPRDARHFGVLIFGEDNALQRNTISSENGETGVFIFDESVNTKLILNDITGWTNSVIDRGDETKQPAPFSE